MKKNYINLLPFFSLSLDPPCYLPSNLTYASSHQYQVDTFSLIIVTTYYIYINVWLCLLYTHTHTHTYRQYMDKYMSITFWVNFDCFCMCVYVFNWSYPTQSLPVKKYNTRCETCPLKLLVMAISATLQIIQIIAIVLDCPQS